MIGECLQPRSCCLLLSLRAGVQVSGLLSLGGSVMLLLWGGSLLVEELKSPYDSNGWSLALLWLCAASHLVQAGTALSLLVAVHTDRVGVMRWWLWITPAAAILDTGLLTSTSAVHHLLHVHRHRVGWYLLTLTTLVNDVIGWVVTFSHYRALRGRGPALV